jgi:ribonuclease-3
MEVARWFVLEQLHEYLTLISGGDVSPNDHKSKLQEVAQATWRKTPQYRITRESGVAHERQFSVQVLVGDVAIGEGAGRSKKEAEQAAAHDALELIERNRAG